jgi:DNA helicase HerA-like ATPase
LLSLGSSFEIDANIAVRRAVLLGQPDAGKTNGLTVIAEGLLRLNVPPVLLDWKGDLWGLRSSAAGDREGFAIAIFGGDHGDVDIDEADGRELGHVVAEEHLSAILDLSAFATDAARRRFAAGFLRGFFNAKKTNVSPHPLLIDEYQKFAPEKPYEGERDLLSVTEQVIGLGRKRGIGVIETALRAAGLNKNIVEVSDVYFFCRWPERTTWLRSAIRSNASRRRKSAAPC